MSVVLAVVCGSATEAEGARATLRDLDVELEDAVIVVRTADGRVDLHQLQELAPGEGIVAGGTAGLVAGMLAGGPVVGALLGMLGGGVWGARDTGVDDTRLRDLGETLEEGRTMLCVLVSDEAAERVREALAGYGEVIEVGGAATRP